jgi:hypothetical protein
MSSIVAAALLNAAVDPSLFSVGSGTKFFHYRANVTAVVHLRIMKATVLLGHEMLIGIWNPL